MRSISIISDKSKGETSCYGPKNHYFKTQWWSDMTFLKSDAVLSQEAWSLPSFGLLYCATLPPSFCFFAVSVLLSHLNWSSRALRSVFHSALLQMICLSSSVSLAELSRFSTLRVLLSVVILVISSSYLRMNLLTFSFKVVSQSFELGGDLLLSHKKQFSQLLFKAFKVFFLTFLSHLSVNFVFFSARTALTSLNSALQWLLTLWIRFCCSHNDAFKTVSLFVVLILYISLIEEPSPVSSPPVPNFTPLLPSVFWGQLHV